MTERPAPAPPTTRPTRATFDEDLDATCTRLSRLGRWSSSAPVDAAEGRRVAADFVARHTGRLYRDLTDDLRRHVTLRELLDGVRTTCPHLLPSDDELAADAALPVRSRHRFEMDQAVVLQAFLRDPTCGEHLLDSMRRPGAHALERARDFDDSGALALDTLTVHRSGAAGCVTLLNVDTLNAEDNQLAADLETAVDVVMLAQTVSVGVLRGGVMRHPKHAGRRVFCAGINLKDVRAGRISYLDFLLGREVGFLSKMTRGHLDTDGRTHHTPWVSVVDSFAIGGGLQMALASDFVVAETSSFFSLPAAQEGIVPGVANLRLPNLVGASLARDMILRGRVVRATEPAARHIAGIVVDAADLDETLDGLVRDLDDPAVRANKRMLAVGLESQHAFREYLAEFVVVQAERMYSDDVLAKGEVGRS